MNFGDEMSELDLVMNQMLFNVTSYWENLGDLIANNLNGGDTEMRLMTDFRIV